MRECGLMFKPTLEMKALSDLREITKEGNDGRKK